MSGVSGVARLRRNLYTGFRRVSGVSIISCEILLSARNVQRLAWRSSEAREKGTSAGPEGWLREEFKSSDDLSLRQPPITTTHNRRRPPVTGQSSS